MFFSVIIPVYNAENYVAAAIESVLQQKYTSFELILVNDASTDSSGNICNKYTGDDRVVVIHKKKNEGQIATRNIGVQHAKGNYLLFLDSDDTFVKDALSILHDYIVKYRTDCVVFGVKRITNENKAVDLWQDSNLELISRKRDLYMKICCDYRYNSMCRKAVKREKALGYDFQKYYSVRHGEDLIQSLHILSKCNSVLFIPDILYLYKIVSSSVSNSVSYENYKVDFSSREFTFEFLESENCFAKKDFDEYINYSRELFCKTIKLIIGFDTSIRNRVNLLKKVMSENLCKNHILNELTYDLKSKKDSMLLWLFANKLYYIMVVLHDIIKKVGYIK